MKHTKGTLFTVLICFENFEESGKTYVEAAS